MVFVYQYISGVAGSAVSRLTVVFKSDAKETAPESSVSVLKQIQRYIRVIVEHSVFNQLFMALILVNTIAMCVALLLNPCAHAQISHNSNIPVPLLVDLEKDKQ